MVSLEGAQGTLGGDCYREPAPGRRWGRCEDRVAHTGDRLPFVTPSGSWGAGVTILSAAGWPGLPLFSHAGSLRQHGHLLFGHPRRSRAGLEQKEGRTGLQRGRWGTDPAVPSSPRPPNMLLSQGRGEGGVCSQAHPAQPQEPQEQGVVGGSQVESSRRPWEDGQCFLCRE